MAYTLIETHTVGASGATEIEFTGITQETGADLVLVVSGKSTRTDSPRDNIKLQFNGVTSGYTYQFLEGSGSAATASASGSQIAIPVFHSLSTNMSGLGNLFGSATITISDYASSNNKLVSSDQTAIRNSTDSHSAIQASLSTITSGITSIYLSPFNGDFTQYTTASLYLVTTADASGATIASPKAAGGTASLSGGYWIHTFTGSGTFTPTENLTCDFLVIAGGGGASGGTGGGAGAGGYRTSAGTSGGGGSAETSLSLTASTGYTVTVGAGGNAGTQYPFLKATNGSDSTFATITSAGGGASGSRGGSTAIVRGVTGGSGGGAGGQSSFNAPPGSGTTNQGFAGGNNYNSSQYTGGGGGGAGAVGADGTSGACGNGGAGVTSSITGSAVARAGGGGAAKANSATSGTGANGGGNGAGTDQVGNPGTAYTGGGAGGGHQEQPGANGGSGIVIVRYAA